MTHARFTWQMMESPDEFYEVVKSLKQMAEDHLCFYGTGAENGMWARWYWNWLSITRQLICCSNAYERQ